MMDLELCWVRRLCLAAAWALGTAAAASSPLTSCDCGATLQAEVEALRSNLPGYLVKIGEPYPARQILTGQKLRSLPANSSCDGGSISERWPWRLKVDISVAKGPYRKEHRVIMLFPSNYPEDFPSLRFGSKIGSAYLSDNDEAHSHIPNEEFQSALEREAMDSEGDGGKVSLRKVLKLLYTMLTKPLEGTESEWHQRAQEFGRETEVVKKYRKKRKHKRLYSVRGFSARDYPDPVEVDLRTALANISSFSDRQQAKASLLETGIIEEVIPGMVYTFRVFTLEFCKLVMDEVLNFQKTGLPARRPNSMNNYGVILNEIGLEPLMFAMQDEIIQPLAAVLLPKEGAELESHHAFTVRYKGGEDTHLDVHTDDSDVTFNVNIFGDYTGCPLVFCGMMGAPDHRHFRTAYQHRVGYAVMHSGRQRHGAEDITSGERVNLIVWSYSYNFRLSAASKKRHKREKGPPDARCVSYTHDRDFGRFKEYPPGKREQFLGRGWCPQQGKEYPGFVPDMPDRGASRQWGDDDEEEL